MKRLICVVFLLAIASIGLSQSFTMVINQAEVGKNGICLGYDPANQKVIRSNFGNPPVIEYLNKDTLAVEGTLATGAVTWGDLGGFAMGVGPDGSIVVIDHIETPDPPVSGNGLVRWTSYSDPSPGLCTAPSSVPFPRYLTILGTGTDQVFICAGSGTGGALNVLTTADAVIWSIAYSVGDPALIPPEPGGQRGCAAYVGSGTNEYPQMVFGCDAHAAGTYNGIHVYDRTGTTYQYWGDMDPTSTDSDDAILSIAVDPGVAPTETADGEKPVLIALGAHASTEHGTALYMFDLRYKMEIAVLPFTAASADIGYYGAIGLDSQNNRVYFSIRNGGDSTLGYASYEPPVWPFTAGASHWNFYP